MYCTCRFYVIRWCCRSQCCASIKNTVDCQGGMAPSPYAQGPQFHSPTRPSGAWKFFSSRAKCWDEKPAKVLMKESLYEALFCLESGSKRWKAIWWITKSDTLQYFETQLVHLCLLENSWAKNLGELWKSTPCPIDCEIVPFFQGLATPKAIP